MNSNNITCSGDSDKTFRCSTFFVKQNKSFLFERQETKTTDDGEPADQVIGGEFKQQNAKMDNLGDDLQIYDVCQIKSQGSDSEEDETVLSEKLQTITCNTYCSLPHLDCPYMDLPAGHLSIHNPTKYGQLQRLEKRLFFDQSKKCYCGILNDWLLCYIDGPTSSRPTISLYLKMPGIEVEHYGEGKRRDVCFQISTCDQNKKLLFQSTNEIDAKEWIHAIETVIRSDIYNLEAKKSPVRKLPTPPVMKKTTFLSSFQRNGELLSNNTSNDGIYEEPAPIQQSCLEQPPKLPNKLHMHSLMDHKFEYDVPKCPAQPLIDSKGTGKDSSDLHTKHNSSEHKQIEQNNMLPTVQDINNKIEENLDFQAKVKDVHNKLSSQLSNGHNSKSPLKKPVQSLLKNNGDSLINNACGLPSSLTVNDSKKQTKSTPPPTSPQKSSNEKCSFSKNWFLNRLNKSNSSSRSIASSPSNSPSKCKQSEKENLLNTSSDTCDGYELGDVNSTSPILKLSPSKNGTSKVNMIINQLESSGHFASMFNADAVASMSPFCDSDYNNYEPIMTVSTSPHNLKKKS